MLYNTEYSGVTKEIHSQTFYNEIIYIIKLKQDPIIFVHFCTFFTTIIHRVNVITVCFPRESLLWLFLIFTTIFNANIQQT